MFKKIIASIVLACFLFVNLGSHVAYAQNTWYYQEWDQWAGRVYDDDNPDEIFGERYTAAQVEWVIYGLFAFVINHAIGNSDFVGCIIRARINNLDITSCLPSLVDTVRRLIENNLIRASDDLNPQETYAYENPVQDILSGERPISGIGYVRNAASKFNLASEVQAQGFGFEAASSMRTLWVAVRNVTYFFLILIIIAMSFMIMFRFKISPQTVITVQSALPKIIIALILITFSYAIAGFMIDLLYVVIGIIAAVLSQSELFVYSPFVGGDPISWTDMYNNLAGVGFGQGIVGVMTYYFLAFGATAITALTSNAVGFAGIFLFGATLIVWVILLVIAFIALTIILIKIIWMVVKTFVTVLLLTVLGPIYIIVGGFGNWLKNLASNLAVFAAIGPMLAISFLFLASALPEYWGFEQVLASSIPFNPAANVLDNSSWAPPFLPGTSGDMDITWLFASFVVITLIPNVANMIKSMIQGRPFGYGTAIGAALGAAAGVAWAPFGTQASALQKSWGEARAGSIIKKMQDSKYGEAIRRFGGF